MIVSAFLFVVLTAPADLLAIHAIIRGKTPLPRRHAGLVLGMPQDEALGIVSGRKVKPAVGQFDDEARYALDPALFPPDAVQVLADFYAGRLFRIEINYKPLPPEPDPLENRIAAWSRRHGAPRENRLPGVRLLFWDDGATRMILEIDREETAVAYSITYIDDDLFHKSSRDRVQRETGGASSYGKGE